MCERLARWWKAEEEGVQKHRNRNVEKLIEVVILRGKRADVDWLES